jgi:hypothetical protein
MNQVMLSKRNKLNVFLLVKAMAISMLFALGCLPEKVEDDNNSSDGLNSGKCTSDAQCPEDETCEDGKCVAVSDEDCESDDDCSEGEKYDNGACVFTCEDDDDCDGEETCEDGACVLPKGTCKDDNDCKEDETCEDGTCVAPVSNVLVIGSSDVGGEVVTSDGTTLTFDAGSLAVGTTVSVETVTYDTMETGGQLFDVVTGFDLEMDGYATLPAEIEVPNTADVPAESQIFIVEVVTLSDGANAINMVGTASVSEDGESIVSNNEADSDAFLGEWGVNESGVYIIIVTDGNQGLTFGQVTDEEGASVAGAAVFSSSGAFVGVTDANGFFAIPEIIGSATLYPVRDGFRDRRLWQPLRGGERYIATGLHHTLLSVGDFRWIAERLL